MLISLGDGYCRMTFLWSALIVVHFMSILPCLWAISVLLNENAAGPKLQRKETGLFHASFNRAFSMGESMTVGCGSWDNTGCEGPAFLSACFPLGTKDNLCLTGVGKTIVIQPSTANARTYINKFKSKHCFKVYHLEVYKLSSTQSVIHESWSLRSSNHLKVCLAQKCSHSNMIYW